jgi:uncharacterized protein YacL
MKNVALTIQRNVLQFVALGLLVAGMLTASKGAAVPALMALGRFIVPVIIVYLAFKLISKKTKGVMQRFQEQILQQAQMQRGASNQGGTVVDLCPTCGDVLKPGHRCNKSKK